MSNVLTWMRKFLLQPKRIFLFVVLYLVFFVSLFSFNDLSAVIKQNIVKASGNSLYLDFESLSLTPLPRPGLKATQVQVVMPNAPEIQMESASIAPAWSRIFDLISGRPAGSVYAEGLYQGVLDASVVPSGVIKDDQAMAISVNYSGMDLGPLTKSLNQKNKLPFVAQGTGQLIANIDMSPKMTPQPEGQVSLQLNDASLSPFSVKTAFGDLPLPGLGLKTVDLQGDLRGGRFTIKKGTLGAPSDNLYGQIKGTVDVKFNPNFRGQRVSLYDLQVELNFKRTLKEELGAMLAFISQFEQKTLNGSKYSFRVSGQPGRPPQLKAQ